MIARALAAQRVERRTKVRVDRDLYERAGVCAREVDEPLARWLDLCTRPLNLRRAQGAGVVVPAAWLLAARGSVVATVEGAHPDPVEVRRCVAAVVLFCESVRPRPVVCSLREGVDYYVEVGE